MPERGGDTNEGGNRSRITTTGVAGRPVRHHTDPGTRAQKGVVVGRLPVARSEDWEYGTPPSIVLWAEGHVLIAVAAATIAWFTAVYVLVVAVGVISG